jgi:hypothetical protein
VARSWSRRWLRSAQVGLVVAVSVTVAGCASAQPTQPTNVTSSGVTLNATVSDNVDATATYWFQYGTTSAYGTETTHRTIDIADRNLHPVSEPVSGLAPATTYHFTVCAQDPQSPVICASDWTVTTSASTQLAIRAQPSLYPAFDPAVTDYVTRCGTGPVAMMVSAPAGTTVGVDGAAQQSGDFGQYVPLTNGQAFGFSTVVAGQTTGYHVRCLPDDFPAWTYTRTKPSNLDDALVTPTLNAQFGSTHYLAFFNPDGVPLWWYKASPIPVDAKLLPDNTVSFATGFGGFGSSPTAASEIRRLDGTLVRTLKTLGSPTDFHDLQVLPNGNYLMTSYRPRDHVDISAYGGPADATVLDGEVQEITPGGALVWWWNTYDHIALSETDGWWPTIVGAPPKLPDGRTVYDIVHLNSVEVDGASMIISLRHADAVYRVNRTTGAIDWKLGGTTTSKSLTVSGDNQTSLFGGQHDPRRLPDGTVTVHDNGTRQSRAPRALRFAVDPNAGTATVVEKLTDPDYPSSGCCGTATKLPTGGWMMGWGGSPSVSEYAADGSQISKLTFANYFSYRTFAVPKGRLAPALLRQGMDAMFPR